MQSGKTIAFVEQEIASSEQPALEFVLDGDVQLRQLEKTLAGEQHDAAWFERSSTSSLSMAMAHRRAPRNC